MVTTSSTSSWKARLLVKASHDFCFSNGDSMTDVEEEEAEKQASIPNEAVGYLLKNLDPDDVFEDVVQENMISLGAQRQIRPSTEDKVRIMVEQFKRSGPGTLKKLCRILRMPVRKDRQGHIAEYLESKCSISKLSAHYHEKRLI